MQNSVGLAKREQIRTSLRPQQNKLVLSTASCSYIFAQSLRVTVCLPSTEITKFTVSFSLLLPCRNNKKEKLSCTHCLSSLKQTIYSLTYSHSSGQMLFQDIACGKPGLFLILCLFCAVLVQPRILASCASVLKKFGLMWFQHFLLVQIRAYCSIMLLWSIFVTCRETVLVLQTSLPPSLFWSLLKFVKDRQEAESVPNTNSNIQAADSCFGDWVYSEVPAGDILRA